MRSLLAAIVAVVATGTSAQGTLPSHYLYEFDIRVAQNQFISLGTGGDLLSLTLGSVGTLSMLVSTEPNQIPGANSPGVTAAYAIEEVVFDMNGITAQGLDSAYPSTNIVTAFLVQDNGLATGGRLLDALTSILALDNSDFGLPVFQLSQLTLPGNPPPTLIQGLDLPTSFDFSLSDGTDFSIGNPAGGPERVNFDVFDATITPVPTPAAVTILALGALTATRRRR